MISVIIPFFNEAESLPTLINQLIRELSLVGGKWEVVLVDDGSTDATSQQVYKVIKSKEEIRIIKLRKQFGKGEALKTGVENAKGDILVFMDGDLQDDPKDISKLIQKINDGYDFVNGVRSKRNDNLMVKIYSKIAGFFLKTFLHSPYEDINCGFKMFKKEVLVNFTFYGNNFRFFPLAVYYSGYKVGQISVTNNPRKFGKSKFGPGKLLFGIFDTVTAYFIYRFSERPLHFFGSVGGGFFLSGFLIALYLSYERIFFGILLYRRPSLLLAILLIIVGLQILMTGIIGELIVYLNKRINK